MRGSWQMMPVAVSSLIYTSEDVWKGRKKKKKASQMICPLTAALEPS